MYAVPDRWHLSRSVVRTGEWEPYITGVFRSFLEPGMTVVDVGANFGHYALTAARYVGPEGLVLAFEPQPEVYADLVRNAALAPSGNIATFPDAAGARDGEARLVVDSSSSGWSSLVGEVVPDPGGSVAVRVRRLSDVLGSRWPSRSVGLLKIDTEGTEAQVLGGAWSVIEKDRPIVIMEFSERRIELAGGSADEVLDRMLSLGYEIEMLDDSRERRIPVSPPVRDWPARFGAALHEEDGGWFTDLLFVPESRARKS